MVAKDELYFELVITRNTIKKNKILMFNIIEVIDLG